MRLSRGFIEDFNVFYLKSSVQLKEQYKNEVIERINFFCLQKCQENNKNINELLFFMRENFIFDENLNIKEIKNNFLKKYKDEIKNSLNRIWLKEKRKYNANYKEKLSALKFIIDFHLYLKNNKLQQDEELLLKHTTIVYSIIQKYDLQKYFSNGIETKEVSKILFDFDLSFNVYEKDLTSFDDFILNKSLKEHILKQVYVKKLKETHFSFKVSDLINRLEKGLKQFSLNDCFKNEKDIVLCDIVNINIYSYNTQYYLDHLKRAFRLKGDHLVYFYKCSIKRGNYFKSEITENIHTMDGRFTSETLATIIFEISQ